MIRTAAEFITQNDPVRVVGTTSSVTAVILSWTSLLTPIATLAASTLSGIWFSLLIYSWFANKKWRPENRRKSK